MAASAMTETVMPPEMLANLKVRDCLMHSVMANPDASLNSLHPLFWLFATPRDQMRPVESLKLEQGSSLRLDGKAVLVLFSNQTRHSRLQPSVFLSLVFLSYTHSQ